MPHTIIHRLFCLLLLSALFPALANAGVLHAVGIARDAKSNNIRYIEHHQYLTDGRLLINYYTRQLERIAYKDISYPGLPQHPQIEQVDFNRQTKTLVTVSPTQIRMTTESPDGNAETLLEPTPELVMDAGFDSYIRANLESLRRADDRKLEFAIAGVDRTLAMRISALPDDPAGNLQFRVSPNNWVVRMFLPAIDLTYSQDGRLLRYAGYSNLVPDRNESRSVVISFKYHETEEEVPMPLAAWLQIPTPVATTD